MVKIPVTHVGSLPRSQKTVDFIFARERGEKYSLPAFDSHMEKVVDAVVRRQKDVGVDIVSDGEMAKISYATYVKDRYSGFAGDSPRNPPADLKKFPSFLKRLIDQGGTPSYARPMCIDKIKSKGQQELQKDIDNLKNAMKKHSVKRGFMNSASPGVIALFLQNSYYPSHEDYLDALAKAMATEYKAITDAGLDIQIDCPDLALSRHMIFSEISDKEFIDIANLHVEVLNQALAEVPKEQVRIHICWGNYEGPHCCDISIDKVFPVLMKTHSRYLSFEAANPRHAHEWEVFLQRKNEIPDDKILIPGLIDSTSNFIEHPRLISQRLQSFIDIVGSDRVYAGTDCGFGTFAGFGAIDSDIAYAKLQSLADGVQLV